MRDKLLIKSDASRTELELPDIALYSINLQGYTKPVGKRLMRQFQTCAGVLCVSLEKLQEIEKVGRPLWRSKSPKQWRFI